MEEILSMKEMQALQIDISIWSVIFSLIVAAVCSSAIKILYVKYGKSLNNRRNFSNIFPMLAITTALVITVVKFSIALSLGLVGALSIVRFRAAIKEPEELVFLFLVIAIGLGAGANQYESTVILTLFIFIFVMIMKKIETKKQGGGVMMNAIQITCTMENYKMVMDLVQEFMGENFSQHNFKSLYKQSDTVRVNYIIDSLDLEDNSKFSALLDSMPNDTDVSIFQNTPIIE
jgi:uncharacterized membrane protein YhiD involved in acid resistance